jgi:hypothetical protein
VGFDRCALEVVPKAVADEKARASAVLKASGYDATSATPKVAEIVLLSQKFDLIVVSRLSDSDLHRVNNLADGTDMLALGALTLPSELILW